MADLVGKIEAEVDIESSAEKFFAVFRSTAHHIPNICPEKIKTIDVHEGDWETVGSVKQWDYVVGGNAENVKETVESIDEVNKVVTFKALEGDLTKDYKSFKSILKVSAKGDGGLVKWSLEYEKLNEDVPHPTKYLDWIVSITKDIDSHLIKA